MELADRAPEKEQITDEERYMFQKLGLRMRARLLLGKLHFVIHLQHYLRFRVGNGGVLMCRTTRSF